MFLGIILLIGFKVIVYAISRIENPPPTVTTSYGKVEGLWKLSYEGRQYSAFEGIPYAKPPVGDLRFEEPQPIAPWNGIWKAKGVNKCIQIGSFLSSDVTGEEDCLYLNIYVPKIENNLKKLDVIVHIHGGGFKLGHGAECTDEKYIMDRDVIYATMHYRLDALGFLSTEDEVVPGNNGLKDQSLAMKWIKENIENFGGNSESITLTGFSAGAASVQFHYLSPLSKNLFNRGMSVSGSALNSFALQKYPGKRAELLAKALGCDTTNKRSMVNCMKTRPAHLLVELTQTALHPSPQYPYVIFAPVIEKGSKNPFLSDQPYQLLKQGKIYDVPWISSATTHEGALFSLPLLDKYNEIDKNWMIHAKYFLQYDETLPESKELEIAEKIRNFYFPEGQTIDVSKYEQITKMWTDRVIVLDAILAAQLQSKANRSPVYFYQFGYEAPHSFKTTWGKSEYKGVPHGDDMAYFFGGLISGPLSEEEKKLKNIALDILYSYAHEGKPSVPNVIWKPVGEQFYFLNISGPSDIKLDIFTDFSAASFWTSLGLLENANLFPDKVKTEL